MKRKGLTLMELLIVIAIIAALAGLLFPVFTTIRERSRIAYCINSLKQVGGALHMYAQDYDGFTPPYTNYAMDANDKHFYFPKSNDPSLFEAAYAPYTKDKQIWYCPLDPFAGMDTPSPPMPGSWAGFMWDSTNHKATSYKIHEVYALIGVAPVHIDFPPPEPEFFYDENDVLRLRLRRDRVVTEYALDFTHSNPSKPWIGIRLFLDGTIKVTIER